LPFNAMTWSPFWVAVLLDDLPGDLALAIERVDGHDTALKPEHLQQFRHRRDLIRLGVGGNLRQHQPLLAAPGRHHVQRRLAARRVERASQHLAIDRHDTLAGLGKPRHEALETVAELLSVEQAEQPTEGIVARSAVLQLEEAAQEPQLGAGELRHVGAVFPAGQHRAQRDHQHLQQIVASGVARPRIVQPGKTGGEAVHRRPRVVINHTLVESIRPAPGNRPAKLSSKFQMRFPWVQSWIEPCL
jgi:hypothetical protein